jgi:hypothetical protein
MAKLLLRRIENEANVPGGQQGLQNQAGGQLLMLCRFQRRTTEIKYQTCSLRVTPSSGRLGRSCECRYQEDVRSKEVASLKDTGNGMVKAGGKH